MTNPVIVAAAYVLLTQNVAPVQPPPLSAPLAGPIWCQLPAAPHQLHNRLTVRWRPTPRPLPVHVLPHHHRHHHLRHR